MLEGTSAVQSDQRFALEAKVQSMRNLLGMKLSQIVAHIGGMEGKNSDLHRMVGDSLTTRMSQLQVQRGVRAGVKICRRLKPVLSGPNSDLRASTKVVSRPATMSTAGAISPAT